MENSAVNRFSEVKTFNAFTTKKFITPDTQFDGLSIRLELWKIGTEIMEKNPTKFWMGIGPGHLQDKIDKKLKDKNFFTGSVNSKNRGFLGYNMHNQYFQTFLETGFIGLIVLLLMLASSLYLGIKYRDEVLIILTLLFMFVFITESFLSRQMGIVSFVTCFILLYMEKKRGDNYIILNRIFDIVFSVLVIIFIISWLVPLLALFSILSTKSFPIFVQTRVGKNGKLFKCFKIRTMIRNHEADFLPAQEDDKRITNIGRFMRKYSLDEFPQFFNVLIGEMSVVGPRPLMKVDEEKFQNLIPGFSNRLIIKPGITGLAQSNGYKGIVNDISDMKIRMKLDLLYGKQKSITTDVLIILKTIKLLFGYK